VIGLILDDGLQPGGQSLVAEGGGLLGAAL
jgi:hypothetical protein